jgi:uncharacterized protein
VNAPPVVTAGLREVLESWSVHSTIHGSAHWRQVATIGRRLLDGTGADPAVVFCFALLHDAARWDDDADPDHGRRAAALVDELVAAGLLGLDGKQSAVLRDACAGHADGRVTADLTVGTCWDADRLDLWRLGTRPRPALLSTATARDPAVIEWARGVRPERWDDLWRAYRVELGGSREARAPARVEHGWRVYAITADGVLSSIPRYGPDVPALYPTVECVATCEQGHQPPEPQHDCGLYFLDRYSAMEASGRLRGTCCQYDFGEPRVYAKVSTAGPVLGDRHWDHLGRLLPHMPYHPRRAAAVRVRELWLPGPDHCGDCAPRTPLVPDEVMAALEARYRVPVRRLAPLGDRPGSSAEPREPPREPGVRSVGRNLPCPCGSGRKYKRCHGRPVGALPP